jgi:hypothetical protein
MNQPNIETEIQQSVRVIRLIDSDLVASDCALRIQLEFDNNDIHQNTKARLKAMMLWINEYLNGSILYHVGSEHETTLFEEINNNVIMCPDEPHDYMMAILIHSKLSAFGGTVITIKSVALESDNSQGFIQRVSGNISQILPDMKSWIGQRHFHAVPWWNRPDSSTVDMKPEDHEDLSKIPELGCDLIADNDQENSTVSTGSAQIIKPSFKPRVITNDD